MRTKLAATLGLSGALLAGATAGVIAGNPAISGAQGTAEQTTSTTMATDTERSPGGHIEEALAPLVANGTITQAQANAVAEALRSAHPAGGHGPGMGRMGAGPGVEAAAAALDMSVADLRAALAGGQTFGQIADSRGVARTTLVDALVAEAKAHLAEKVAEGDLTQAEADARASELTARITERLDATRPARPGR